MKKVIIIILILLIYINLGYAFEINIQEEISLPNIEANIQKITQNQYSNNEYSSLKYGKLTGSEIQSYIETYIRTYNSLVEIQKDSEKQYFSLYGNFKITAIVSNGFIVYLFNHSEYAVNEFSIINLTDYPDYSPLFIRRNSFERASIIKSVTINGQSFHMIRPLYFDIIKSEYAEGEAYHNFMLEYRELIYKEAQKIAEKNPSYEPNVQKLLKQKELMNYRENTGVYSSDINGTFLWMEDSRLYEKLANESGLSKDEGKEYRKLSIPKKEIFGIDIDVFEYKNNLLGYIIPVFGLIIFSLTIRKILDKMKTKIELLEKWYDMISLPVLAVFVYSIKPYDLQMYESFTIIIMFLVSAFYILKYEQKIEANKMH